MRLHILGALALSLCTVSAFENTSPFFYFSTNKLAQDTPTFPSIIKASSLIKKIKPQLTSCLSDAYVIVSQPQVDNEDFYASNATPRLRQGMLQKGVVMSSLQALDVKGEVDLEVLQELLETECEAEIMHVDASTGSFEMVSDMKPRVIRVNFDPLPHAKLKRNKQLSQNDAFLSSILDLLSTNKYTVLYTTTPSTYKRPAPDPAPSPDRELKKRHDHLLNNHAAHEARSDHHHHHQEHEAPEEKRDTATNVTLIDGPLFRRYQFFTPGLFTGLLISIPLFLILWVAISAVASVKVSYAAFDKDMGPAAQNKGKVPQ